MNFNLAINLAVTLAVFSLIGCSRMSQFETLSSESQQSASHRLGDMTRAAYLDRVDEMVRLLRAGADINENIGTAENQITPLTAAVLMGHSKSVRFLLNSGANPAVSYDGFALFHFALTGDDDRIADELFRKMNPDSPQK